MRKLPKSRLMIVAAVIVGVFTCAFISLSIIGASSNAQPFIYTSGIGDVAMLPTATGMPRLTATAQPTQAATSAALGLIAPGAGIMETGGGGSGDAEQSLQSEQPRRIVIRNATLNITVEETEDRVNAIASMAEGLGGWVVSSSTSVSGGTAERPNVYGNITIRIPAEAFDAALGGIREMATIVNNEQITGQDVTQDYVDTSSRLRNLEAAELQLQTIMESAVSVEEVLGVYTQLVQTRSEIEVARGRLQYFDQAAAFSSIAITLNPTSAPVVQAAPTGWNPMVTVTRGVEGLVRFAQTAVDNLIILAIYVLPFLLVFGYPAYQLWKWARRRINFREVLKRDQMTTPASATSDTEAL